MMPCLFASLLGLVYKKGKFSRIEDQQLEFAIENFRKVLRCLGSL
jgi:hypothetical protein